MSQSTYSTLELFMSMGICNNSSTKNHLTTMKDHIHWFHQSWKGESISRSMQIWCYLNPKGIQSICLWLSKIIYPINTTTYQIFKFLMISQWMQCHQKSFLYIKLLSTQNLSLLISLAECNSSKGSLKR